VFDRLELSTWRAQHIVKAVYRVVGMMTVNNTVTVHTHSKAKQILKTNPKKADLLSKLRAIASSKGIKIDHLRLPSPLIRALSAHLAAQFNILPARWQHVWLVAIVPPKRWGKMDLNYCHTAWGNLKTLNSSLHHNKNYACFFS
jgi:hypothetical protein